MPKTLLLADDSVVIQKLVALSFANEEVDLITVYNGDEALQKVRESVPDLVLADVVMPGKNGYEVCEAIKGDPQLRHIPVLLLTGTFEAFDEERARQVGSDGRITKPFEAQALVARVNELLTSTARTAETAMAAPTGVPAAPSGGGLPRTPGDSLDFFDETLGDPQEQGAIGEQGAPGGPGGDRTVAIMPEELELDNGMGATAAPPAQPIGRVIGGGSAAPADPADPGATVVAGSDFGGPVSPSAAADAGATVVANAPLSSTVDTGPTLPAPPTDLVAVDFDHQPTVSTKEINDKPADRVLSPEVIPVESAPTKVTRGMIRSRSIRHDALASRGVESNL